MYSQWKQPDILVTFQMSPPCNDIFFPHQLLGRQLKYWVHYGPEQNVVSKGTSSYRRCLRTVGKMRCLHSRIPQREQCQIYACLQGARNRLCTVPARCFRSHEATQLWDEWNEVNHLGGCSQAIDFMGHQITPGLAEHMPFSAGRRLSFSQINSSNYPAPPTAINSESIMQYSRTEDGEIRYYWLNHTKVTLHQVDSAFFKLLIQTDWLFQSDIIFIFYKIFANL